MGGRRKNQRKKGVGGESIENNDKTNSDSQVQSQPRKAFVHKLYAMLIDPQLAHLMWWVGSEDDDTGTFAVYASDEFGSALNRYFKHANVSSFVRQLHMYGFHKISAQDRESYRGQETEESRVKRQAALNSDSNCEIWEFSHGSKMFRKGAEQQVSTIKRRQPASSSKSKSTASEYHQNIEFDVQQRTKSLEYPRFFIPTPIPRAASFPPAQYPIPNQYNNNTMPPPPPIASPQQPASRNSQPELPSSRPVLPSSRPSPLYANSYGASINAAIESTHRLRMSQTNLFHRSNSLQNSINNAAGDVTRFVDTLPKLEPLIKQIDEENLHKLQSLKSSFQQRTELSPRFSPARNFDPNISHHSFATPSYLNDDNKPRAPSLVDPLSAAPDPLRKLPDPSALMAVSAAQNKLSGSISSGSSRSYTSSFSSMRTSTSSVTSSLSHLLHGHDSKPEETPIFFPLEPEEASKSDIGVISEESETEPYLAKDKSSVPISSLLDEKGKEAVVEGLNESIESGGENISLKGESGLKGESIDSRGEREDLKSDNIESLQKENIGSKTEIIEQPSKSETIEKGPRKRAHPQSPVTTSKEQRSDKLRKE